MQSLLSSCRCCHWCFHSSNSENFYNYIQKCVLRFNFSTFAGVFFCRRKEKTCILTLSFLSALFFCSFFIVFFLSITVVCFLELITLIVCRVVYVRTYIGLLNSFNAYIFVSELSKSVLHFSD